MNPDKAYAVLSGDIVDSTDLAPAEIQAVFEHVERAVMAFKVAGWGRLSGPDFYSGDSWQIVLDTPEQALRLALYLNAYVWAASEVRMRISIGIGQIDTLDPEAVSRSFGEAFVLSGRALKRMTLYFDLTCAVPETAKPLTTWLPVVTHLCSSLVRQWTQRQAEVLSHAVLMQTPLHEEVAASLDPPVRKQTASDVLRAANWRSLQEPLKAFAQTDWDAVIAQSDRETRTRQE